MFLGVTVPVLLLSVFGLLITANTGGSLPQPPRAEIGGGCPEATPQPGETRACETPGTTQGRVVATATPVPDKPTPAWRTYAVQAGDTLSVICANEVPDLSSDACIEEIVSLSELDGPNDLSVGQELRLPPLASASPSSAAPAPSRTPASRGAVAEETPATEDESAGGSGAAANASDAEEGGADDNAESEASDAASDVSLPADFDVNDARLYVVQDGDSLLTICSGQVSGLTTEECMQIVVLLNDLEGTDEIFASQELLLP
jgi:LysM domain-containing protein